MFGILENAMIAFEDVFFGHHTLERERFEACWRQVGAFQKEMQQRELQQREQLAA